MKVRELRERLERVENQELEVIAFLDAQGKGFNRLHMVIESQHVTEDGYGIQIPEVDSEEVVALWPH